MQEGSSHVELPPLAEIPWWCRCLKIKTGAQTGSLCCLSLVKNPPAEPSQYLSVPPKIPDKMGFDEVSWRHRGGARPVAGGVGRALGVHATPRCPLPPGIHDQPEAPGGPARAHAADLVRAGDRVQGGRGGGWEVSEGWGGGRRIEAKGANVPRVAAAAPCPAALQSHEQQRGGSAGHQNAAGLQGPLPRPAAHQGGAGLLPQPLQDLEGGERGSGGGFSHPQSLGGKELGCACICEAEEGHGSWRWVVGVLFSYFLTVEFVFFF